MTPDPRLEVVMISPALPEKVPEHAGGRLLADIVRTVAPHARVSVIVPDGPAVRRAEPLDELHRVVRVEHEATDRSFPVSRYLERFVWTGSPPRWFSSTLRRHPAALDLLRGADIIDLQWQEQSALIPWLRQINQRARITVTLHDVNSQRDGRALHAVRGHGARSTLVRARWAWARRRALAAEARLTGASGSKGVADAVAVLSRKDAELLPSGAADVVIMTPPLADTYAHVRRAPRVGQAEILMVAYLARWVNEEGLTWFAKDVLPLIRSEVPTATLRVAGTGIRPSVAHLAEENDVELMGFVPDLNSAYESANAVVVPLLQGAGVKFKVVDALSAGVPVITTPVGAEGIGETDWFAGLTDDPQQFADAVVAVLKDQQRAEQRAQRARNLLASSFGRSAFQTSVRRLYGLETPSGPAAEVPHVSVVIPAFNAADVIDRQLSALANQVDAPPFEVIVANNRSTDSTAAVAARRAEHFPCGLRVISAFGAQGVSHARNAGIQAARADKILICDADDAVATNWVKTMSAALDIYDLVGSSQVRRQPQQPSSEAATDEPVRSIFGYLPYVAGSAIGFTKVAWSLVQGFDEAFPAGHEEVDFCWRIQEAGFRLGGVPETHVQYLQRDTLRATVRQHRAYSQGAMLLWTRYEGHAPMPPVSFVRSARDALVQSVQSWPLLVGRGDSRMARDLGWSLGVVAGHIRYRKAGKPPTPPLMAGSRPRMIRQSPSIQTLVHAPRHRRPQGGPLAATKPAADARVSALVTVLIPHYGSSAPTLRLIRQLADQTGLNGLRVVISDDASPEVFDVPGLEASGRPPGTDLRITMVRRSTNGGFGANVNSGLKMVETPYVLVLNSDLEIASDFVSRLTHAALPHQPAVVAPRVLGPDGSEQWVGRHFPTVAHQAVEWLSPLARWRHTRLLHEAVGHDTRATGTATTSVDWVMGAALFLPVEQVRTVGAFAEDYFMNAEEVDLQRRLRPVGVESVVVGAVTVTHEGGGSSDPLRRRAWLVDARSLYAKKWGHPIALKCALTVATGANLAFNSLRAAAGKDVRPLQTARTELALVHPVLRRKRV